MVTTKVTTTSTEWLPWQSIHGQEPEEGAPKWIREKYKSKAGSEKSKEKSEDESGKSKEKENEE